MAKLQGDSIGENVFAVIEGTTLVIRIDLSAPGRPSASDKNMVIATTRGNKAIKPGTFIGVNLYKNK
jgi:hypothetical protein